MNEIEKEIGKVSDRNCLVVAVFYKWIIKKWERKRLIGRGGGERKRINILMKMLHVSLD